MGDQTDRLVKKPNYLKRLVFLLPFPATFCQKHQGWLVGMCDMNMIIALLLF